MSNWIRVEDRLPTAAGYYLAWNDIIKVILMPYWDKEWIYKYDLSCVTHWMPLPDPPTKQ